MLHHHDVAVADLNDSVVHNPMSGPRCFFAIRVWLFFQLFSLSSFGFACSSLKISEMCIKTHPLLALPLKFIRDPVAADEGGLRRSSLI